MSTLSEAEEKRLHQIHDERIKMRLQGKSHKEIFEYLRSLKETGQLAEVVQLLSSKEWAQRELADNELLLKVAPVMTLLFFLLSFVNWWFGVAFALLGLPLTFHASESVKIARAKLSIATANLERWSEREGTT